MIAPMSGKYEIDVSEGMPQVEVLNPHTPEAKLVVTFTVMPTVEGLDRLMETTERAWHAFHPGMPIEYRLPAVEHA